MRIVPAVVVLLLLRAGPAAADLYRWIDPETGSIKFSSYPPPWYGDAAAQRHAPKVEVIPARASTARPGPGGKAEEDSRAMEALEARRKELLQQLATVAAQSGGARPGPALEKQVEAYAALADQLDKLDPAGAAARRGELQMVIEKIGKGEPR
jgi:hypothetical protein